MADGVIQELLEEIKSISLGKASKDELNTKTAELLTALDNRNKDMDKQFSDMQTEMEKKLAEMQKVGVPPNLVQKELEQKYGKTFGDFMVKVRNKSSELKDLSITSGEGGGYLAPEVYSNEILSLALENSVVRNRSRVINMSSNILKIPALNMDSNANGSLYGGVAAYWTDAGGSMTESQPKFKRITLEPKKLTVYTESDDELIEDAITSLGNLMQRMFAETIAFEEDEAFLRGTGVGQPLGILNAPALVTVSRATTSDVLTADLINMMARFKGNNGVWVMNQSVLPSIFKLKDENSNYILLPGMSGNITGSLPGNIYGYPVVITEKCSALGTSGDIMLCDFGFYLIGDRRRVTIDESIHYKFQNGQLAWRCTERVDGQPWLQTPVTPRRGGSTLSPFVAIG